MSYRGTLEICEDTRKAKFRLFELENELRAMTGKDYDEFVEGMRALLAPKETA